MTRKIIQIAIAKAIAVISSPEEVEVEREESVIALCDDGTVWNYELDWETHRYSWNRILEIPQDIEPPRQ